MKINELVAISLLVVEEEINKEDILMSFLKVWNTRYSEDGVFIMKIFTQAHFFVIDFINIYCYYEIWAYSFRKIKKHRANDTD